MMATTPMQQFVSLLLFSQAVLASEDLVKNAPSCKSIQDPRKRLDCRAARAGGQQCSDRTLCRDPHSMEMTLMHIPPPKRILQPQYSTEPTGTTTLYTPNNGTAGIETWKEALSFCLAKKHSGLASLADYCGSQQGLTAFPAVPSDQWAPMGDCGNCHVQVGDGGAETHGWRTCGTHLESVGESPGWGMEAGKEPWEANYVLCVDYFADSELDPTQSTVTWNQDSFGRDPLDPSWEKSQLFLPVYQCSEDDAARRIGMTCESFPYYNGGFPILAGGIRWDSEWEHYRCTDAATPNGTTASFCQNWSNREESDHEYELGLYECEETATTPLGIEYCKSWTSAQRETKKCGVGVHSCQPNCEEPTFCRKECCTTDDNGNTRCRDCSYAPITEYEYFTATCHNVTDQGACLYWTQEEFDEHNYHFREYEEYTCLEVSSNQAYCRRWFGNIDSEEEFEISSCQCVEEDGEDVQFCKEWVCYEQGINYYYPNYIWVLLPVLASAYCGAGMLGAVENGEWCCMGLVYLIFFSGLTIAVAHLCGLVGVLIAVAICWFLYPCLAFFVSTREKKQKIMKALKLDKLRGLCCKGKREDSDEEPEYHLETTRDEFPETAPESENKVPESAPEEVLPVASATPIMSESHSHVPMAAASVTQRNDQDFTT